MFALLIAGKMTREGSQSSLDLYQGSHFDEGAIKMEIQFRQGARQGMRAAKSTYFLRFNRVFLLICLICFSCTKFAECDLIWEENEEI